MMEPVIKYPVELVVVNHDNTCVVNWSFFVENIDGSVLVESNSLFDMFSLENVTPIINSLISLQQLNSTHNNSTTIHTSFNV